MGRVFDALMRAEKENAAADRFFTDGPRGSEADAYPTHAVVVDASVADEQARAASLNNLPAASRSSASSPASTAHTDVLTGQALPGGTSSRVAGATVDAVGSPRAVRFVSQDINPARVEPHLVAITQPRSAYCEEYRSLRTHVLHSNRTGKSQAIVVTSAGMGEGKSLTALNLAWLLAQTDGCRALIIDADLRHPCLTDYLGLDPCVGLSDMLQEKVRLEQAVMRLEPSGLHLMTGGEARDDVAELLSGPRFTNILNQARQAFDYIIIDAPPLGIFTDATLLINQADAAMLVVRSGKTKYSLVNRLLDTLPRDRMLGVVVNRSQQQLPENNYYYQRRDSRVELPPVAAGRLPATGRRQRPALVESESI
ncbi:MAG: CpsD/CapB family tyrosine-protein kinase [Pyrinomonadaceae bacterium]